MTFADNTSVPSPAIDASILIPTTIASVKYPPTGRVISRCNTSPRNVTGILKKPSVLSYVDAAANSLTEGGLIGISSSAGSACWMSRIGVRSLYRSSLFTPSMTSNR